MTAVSTKSLMEVLDQPIAAKIKHRDPFTGELAELAERQMARANRSLALFTAMRKLVDQPNLYLCLGSLMLHAHEGTAVGARLLSAFLDVATPGARLIPRVREFKSGKRIRLRILSDPCNISTFQKDWLRRLDKMVPQAEAVLKERHVDSPKSRDEASQDQPWAVLCSTQLTLLRLIATGAVINKKERALLASLVELEVDAWQERISNLAGTVDPFRVTAIVRLLPMLSKSDVEVKDLRQLVSWIRVGDDHTAFNKLVPRAHEVFETREVASFQKTMVGNQSLEQLAGLWKLQNEQPVPLTSLAIGAARIMALSWRLVKLGKREEPLNLMSATRFVLEHHRQGNVTIPLSESWEEIICEALAIPVEEEGPAGWSVHGFAVQEDQLVLDIRPETQGDRIWPHDFPTLLDKDPAMMTEDEILQGTVPDVDEYADAEGSKDQTTAAIKQMVMNNIQSVSILLGFLRNAKITAIPGLVATVAVRTRNPQIIETIANDRSLYSGFANREVPLVCLRSPCNVSVKVIRKFIHVKYVSKLELKRLLKDKAGMRREVLREIKLYLENLA